MKFYNSRLLYLVLTVIFLFLTGFMSGSAKSKKGIIKITSLATPSYKLEVYFTSKMKDSIGIDFVYLGTNFLCRDDSSVYDYFTSGDKIVINTLFDEHIISRKIRTRSYSMKFDIPDTVNRFYFTTNLYNYQEFVDLVTKNSQLDGKVAKDYSFSHHNDGFKVYNLTKQKIKILLSIDGIRGENINVVDMRVENSVKW